MIKNLIFLFIIALNFLFYVFFKEENINEVKIIIKPGMELNQIANLLKQITSYNPRTNYKLGIRKFLKWYIDYYN